MHAKIELFSTTFTAFGQTISLKKTKVMFALPLDQFYTKQNIFNQSTRLDVVDSFTSLRSTLKRDNLILKYVYGSENPSSSLEIFRIIFV